MMNTFKLAPSEWRIIFNICGRPGIMGAFVWLMIAKPYVFFGNTKPNVPGHPLFFPVRKYAFPFFLLRPDKVLKLHLFKFAASEGKISRRNFISKCLSDLRNTKRNLHARGVNDIAKVHKYPLRDCSREVADLV